VVEFLVNKGEVNEEVLKVFPKNKKEEYSEIQPNVLKNQTMSKRKIISAKTKRQKEENESVAVQTEFRKQDKENSATQTETDKKDKTSRFIQTNSPPLFHSSAVQTNSIATLDATSSTPALESKNERTETETTDDFETPYSSEFSLL